MLAPKRMSRLLIVASKDQMAAVTGALFRTRLFHIEDFVVDGREGYEGFAIGSPLPGASEASSELVKVRSIAGTFSVSPEEFESKGKQRQAEIKAQIEKELPRIEKEVSGLTARRSKCEASIKEAEQKIAEIGPFVPVGIDLSLYTGYERFSVLAGYVARDAAVGEPAEIGTVKSGKGSFVVAVVPNERRADVERSLQESGFTPVQIPDESGMPQERIDAYTAEIARAKAGIAEIDARLNSIKGEHASFLVACDEILKAEVEQAEAPLRFATTEQTFVAEGWVPAEKADHVRAVVSEATKGKAFVTPLEIDPMDPVPVEYDNPSFAKPSQVLMDVYARPKYTEVDPTLMLAIIFPLFFGIIVGDVGYGLILLAMAFLLHRFFKGEEAGQLLTVLRNASISSIFFGILFSEFLGFPIPGWNPVFYSRHLMAEGGHGPNIPELMVISIWIGIMHITLGRALSMVNHAKQDHGEHRTKAILANLGWIFVMWGILIAVWSIASIPVMPSLTGAPAIAGIRIGIVAGVVLVVLGILFIARDSMLETVEILSVVSHTLSYARIIAVGLSSVAIAMVVNYMSITMFIEPQLNNLSIVGIIIIVFGVVVFLLGHTLNTALGIMGGGLHSIRLHYVEFFTKFYKGGGIRYNPFGLKRRFTEE